MGFLPSVCRAYARHSDQQNTQWRAASTRGTPDGLRCGNPENWLIEPLCDG